MTIKSLLFILISAFSFNAYANHHGDATKDMTEKATKMAENTDDAVKDGGETMEEAKEEMADDAEAADDEGADTMDDSEEEAPEAE